MSRSRRAFAVIAAAAATLLALSGCAEVVEPVYEPPPQAEGALPAETVTALEEALAHAQEVTRASGAIAGVWVPWAGSWVTAVGVQDPGSSTRVTTDMTFRIADVTRLMTCDVLYALDDERVLSKDDPVSRHVPGTPNLEDVTLLDLCNGTAGIGSFSSTVDAIARANPERVWSPMELAAYGIGKNRTETKTAFRDSDAAYMLLGIAFERATGKTASELIDEYVAGPIGLSSTYLPEPAASEPGDLPLHGHFLPAVSGGHDCTAPVDVTRASSSIGYTDSGVVSTIDDLARYMRATASQALAGGAESTRWSSPLPASSTAELWRQATGGADFAGPLLGGFGVVPGYVTAAFSDPETGFTVAVVLNDSTAGQSAIAFLAWELAAIASKVPAASGHTAPDFALPFTAEQYHDLLSKRAITCVAPAEEAEDAEEE